MLPPVPIHRPVPGTMRAIFLAAGCTLALDGLALAPPVFLDTVDLIAVGGPLSALGTPGEGALAAGVCRLPPGWGAAGWDMAGWGPDRGAVGEGGRCRLPTDARAQQTDPAAPRQSGWRADGRAPAAHGGGLGGALGGAFDRGFALGPDGGGRGNGGAEAPRGNGGGDPSWPVDPGGGFSPPAVAFLGGGGGAPRHGDRGGGTDGSSGGFSPGGNLPGTGGVPGIALGASGAQPNGTPVPAPNGAAVLAVGLAGLAWLRRRGRGGRGAMPARRM